MKNPLFNIIIRTSNRPIFFSRCIQSIKRQSYPNYRILVGYDDDDSKLYVEKFSSLTVIRVNNIGFEDDHRPERFTKVGEHFFPNQYMNDLLSLVQEGFIIFIDDDDYFRSSLSLEKIANQIHSKKDMVFWRVQFSPNNLVPNDDHFGKKPEFGQINTSGFCFHSDYISYAKWDSLKGGDYFVASKLNEAIPNKKYINQALTGTQMNNGKAGLGNRIDLDDNNLIEQFNRDGYIDSIKILEDNQCETFINNVQLENAAPVDWDKGHAISSRFVYELASNETVLSTVKNLIGQDILLWGASLIHRHPGQVHAWHCDGENRRDDKGKTVSVWLGLKNSNPDTSLHIIRASHKHSKSVQECRIENNVDRDKATAEQVVLWAREEIDECNLVQCDTLNGEALFFDGRIWHYSHNRSNETRTAILLQYTTPEKPIRILNLRNLDWPFHFLDKPLPPCLLLAGGDNYGVNKVVLPPISRESEFVALKSGRVEPLDVPLPPLSEGQIWRPFHMFRGITPCVEDFACHVSSLAPGHTPHPPHNHKEEEILIVLNGEVELELPELSSKIRLNEGEFVYYPSFFWHTLTAIGEKPANYLMLKWYSSNSNKNEVGYQKCKAIDKMDLGNESIKYGVLIDGQTNTLNKLQCHTSILQPGKGYPPHRDSYDVVIIVLEGVIQTLDSRIGPFGVIYYPAGSKHGMFNPSDDIARYIVFEFHSNHRNAQEVIPNQFVQNQLNREKQDLNASIKGLKKDLELREQHCLKTEKQIQEITKSYSWKIGRFITALIDKLVGWIPFIRRLYS